MKSFFSFLAMATIAGCGSSGPPPLPGNALAVTIGPITIQPAQEVVKCSIVKLPTSADIDVVRLRTTLAPGSHHLILYRSNATAEQPPTDCHSFDGVDKGESPVFIAEAAQTDMQLPTGVAYHFTAGQMVRLEAHYINTTQAPLSALGKVELVPGQGGLTYQPADIMMCGSVAALACEAFGGIDPGDPNATLRVGFYNGVGYNAYGHSQDVDLTKLKVFAFTSHEHHRGTDVKIWKSSSNAPTGAPIYDNPSWSNPPLTVLDAQHLLTFGPGEGLAWQCSYDTTGDTQKICFGESAENNEMCFIWAYYYPSVGRLIAQDDCWVN